MKSALIAAGSLALCVFASPVSAESLLICQGPSAIGVEVRCGESLEALKAATPTSLFSLYSEGWKLVGTQNKNLGGMQTTHVYNFVFFLQK